MADKIHRYPVLIEWNSAQGSTESYTSYKRDFSILVSGKEMLMGSSDPNFRGNPKLYNPEEMLVASLASCHMLWYLHLCAINHIHLVAYQDAAIGIMEENKQGGRFQEVTLYPKVVIKKGHDKLLAEKLHEDAHHYCFIANSVNFPVKYIVNVAEE